MPAPDEMPPTPSAAPPTVRTVRPVRRSRAAPPALALALSLLGVVVPLVGAVAALLGARVLVRRRHEPMTEGDRTMSIAAIVVGIVGCIVSTAIAAIIGLSMTMMASQVRAVATQAPLITVSRLLASRGAYPDHLARRLLDGGVASGELLDAAGLSGQDLKVGSVSLAGWANGADDRAALAAALDGLDLSAPWYPLGRVRIVRLPRRVDEPDLVLAWIHEPTDARVFVLMTDGRVRTFEDGEWTAMWNRDSATRVRLDLPPMPVPPLE